MPNPYDQLFDDPPPEKNPEPAVDPQPAFKFNDDFNPDGPDALDEILALAKTRAADFRPGP